MAEEELTEDDLLKAAAKLVSTTTMPEEKQNTHTFLFNVARSKDTTKLGYLKEEELGMPKLPVRAHKSMALVADKIMGNEFFKEYFEAESEIITSTSLSRDAKLIELAVIQRREIADMTKRRKKPNKGWFTPKSKPEESSSL